MAMCKISVLLVAALLATASAGGDLSRYFALMDLNADGSLSVQELVAQFNAVDEGMGFKASKHGDMTLLFEEYDVDRNNRWSLQEFLNISPNVPDITVAGTTPQQIHTSLTNSSSSTDGTLQLVIMWVTGEKTATSTVQYGQSDLTLSAQGTTHTYTEGGWIGVIHQVILPVLAANTRFSYRVGDEKGGFSSIYNVVTPPTPGDTASLPHVFGVFGDMGTAIPLGYKVCEQIATDHAKLPFNALLHVGDIAYASTAVSTPLAVAGFKGKPDLQKGGDGEIELIWDVWARQAEPIAAFIPYVAGVGNHEKFYNYSSYLARFKNPAPWGGSPHQPDDAIFWFSFDYGLVHFTFMSTEHPYEPGTPQYDWLVNDLAAAVANRERVPWIVLTGHRPMYSSDTDEKGDHWPGGHFQVTIEPLMARYAVDLYYCGHMHVYERIHPVLNGTTMQTGNVYTRPKAPVHVVQGTAGVFEDFKWVEPAPSWSAKRDGRIGYGRMHVFNATHMYYESMYVQDGLAFDSFWLIH